MMMAKIIANQITPGVIRKLNTASLNVTGFEVPVVMPLKGRIRTMPTIAPSKASSSDSNTKEVRILGRENPITRKVAISRAR